LQKANVTKLTETISSSTLRTGDLVVHRGCSLSY